MKCLECGDRNVKYVIRHALVRFPETEYKTDGKGLCIMCFVKLADSYVTEPLE